MKHTLPALRPWPLLGLCCAIIAILAGLIFAGAPAPKVTSPEDLPWHVEPVAPNTVRVLGLTLGVSTATDAESRFREPVTPGLFRRKDGTLTAEAYCERVRTAGLQAKIVFGIVAPEDALQSMLARSPGRGPASQGQRIFLSPADAAWLRTQPIRSLTYLPSARPPESTFIQHFGPPAARIAEPIDGGTAIHLLYPRIGLDITLGEGHKPILQYVRPVDFKKLIQPLRQVGKDKKPA